MGLTLKDYVMYSEPSNFEHNVGMSAKRTATETLRLELENKNSCSPSYVRMPGEIILCNILLL